MDIQKSQFPQELVGIIRHVSESHFIAFDLEFSGIAVRRKAPPGGKRDKLTLQEMYTDLKEAAEKYQILQVGLTVVKEDKKTGEISCRARSHWSCQTSSTFYMLSRS
jgi:poly(A)-specific ribonuclease